MQQRNGTFCGNHTIINKFIMGQNYPQRDIYVLTAVAKILTKIILIKEHREILIYRKQANSRSGCLTYSSSNSRKFSTAFKVIVCGILNGGGHYEGTNSYFPNYI